MKTGKAEQLTQLCVRTRPDLCDFTDLWTLNTDVIGSSTTPTVHVNEDLPRSSAAAPTKAANTAFCQLMGDHTLNI